MSYCSSFRFSQRNVLLKIDIVTFPVILSKNIVGGDIIVAYLQSCEISCRKKNIFFYIADLILHEEYMNLRSWSLSNVIHLSWLVVFGFKNFNG